MAFCGCGGVATVAVTSGIAGSLTLVLVVWLNEPVLGAAFGSAFTGTDANSAFGRAAFEEDKDSCLKDRLCCS